jgi:acetyl-CoA acetyltransferase
VRDKYAIVGTATSDLGRTGKDSLFLLEQAMRRAIDDAGGLKASDIDGIVSRGPDDVYTHHQRMGARLGIDVRFSTSLDNGGASQILAVALACMAIDAGLATTVITGYGRNSYTRTHASESSRTQMELVPDDQLPKEFAPEYGYFGAPGTHAMGAMRHMYEFGTKREHFGRVAIDFRDHALRNPNAVMKKPLTMDDYLGARMIAEPYGLYDCSLVSDGAGATIVTSLDRAKSLKQTPIAIKGFGTFNNTRGWIVEDHMINLAASKVPRRRTRWPACRRRTSTRRRFTIASPAWSSRNWKITGSARKVRAAHSSPRARCNSAGRCRRTRRAANSPKPTSRACCKSLRRCGSSGIRTAPNVK